MILDAESLELVNAIETLLEPAPSGEIKPELMESVLEISTDPCPNTAEAGEQLRALRRQVAQTAAAKNLAIGSAGTHPFAMWEDQRIVARPRYRDLISALRFVARQELIFGMHVHVGIDDPDKAIHVANGMRVHVPVLLGLSANSPFWRADATGLASTRTPIFRAFPRVGHPAHLQGLGGLRAPDRVHDRGAGDRGLHLPVARRAPAPELRHGRGPGDGLPDPRRAHARAGRARPGPGQGAVRALRGRASSCRRYPFEMLDENKWLAARHGLEGELVDLPSSERVLDPRAGPAAARPDARALPGPRLGWTSSRRSRTCSSGATARPARSSSTRPTTTSARSWPRSSPPPPSKRTGPGSDLGAALQSAS